ncbi:MAG TPA: oligosaccharide flippase family protein [Candidatus Sphingobacterium stercoripullorum]|uniref:Oligosaccharide flippase family protein n=1 Tax=Candidatus Sphingobacterium stercoripullorum TaxID=2838759 RepID=A0A9D1W7T4_9SPHI|nr:oligosaccharide flippase family protein [Candidatus Sphingobacterium stercoripullorum]
MQPVKKFLSDTVIYGLSTIITKLLNFLLTPFYVTLFRPSVYSVFTTLYAWSALLNALLAFGMETTYFRFIEKTQKEDRNRVYNNSFTIILILSVVFLTTVLVFVNPIANWLSPTPEHTGLYKLYTKVFAGILVADALAVVPFAKIRAQQKALRFGLIKVLNILTNIGLNVLLLIILPKLAPFEVLGYTFSIASSGPWIGFVFIANLAASILTLFFLIPEIKTVKLTIDKPVAKEMLRYSFPIFIANLSFIINEHVDKMLFPKLLPGEQGAIDLGVYGAVSKIAVFLNLFVTGFRLGAEPFFFSYAKELDAQKVYAQIMEYFVITMVLVMVGLSANISWLQYFVGGVGENQEAYWSGLFIIPFLLLNYVLLGIYINLSIWYKLTDQTRYAIYISGIGAIVTVVLTYLLVPIYSYVGAVLATTTAYLTMVLFSFIWGQKNYPIPYKVNKLCFYILIGTFLSWSCFEILEANFLSSNLLFITFTALVVYSERKAIQLFFKK